MFSGFFGGKKRKLPEPEPEVRFSLLTDLAFIPTKANLTDAGYDLYATRDCEIPVRGKGIIDTQVTVEFPLGYCGLIQGRSGLAFNHSILVHSGVVDYGYSGPVKVALFNLGQRGFRVKKGNRIAQIVITKIHQASGTPERTRRGASGFGSSGD
jgi:dUTP pyrophosphatase